jgi:putative periplasmic protein cpxP
MYERLDKLREELKRAQKRKLSADKKLKLAEERLREAENSQILSDVGALNLTPEQVSQFLRLAATGQLSEVCTLVSGSSEISDACEIKEGEDANRELLDNSGREDEADE